MCLDFLKRMFCKETVLSSDPASPVPSVPNPQPQPAPQGEPKMTDKFNRALAFTLDHEGYKSDDAGDLGKLTIWGIASAFYPQEVAKMNSMTSDEAKAVAGKIYLDNYWTPLNCEGFDEDMALALFDGAVNCGVGTVKKWLIDLVDTGHYFTYQDILLRRMQRYAEICVANPKLNQFLIVWTERVVDLWKLCYKKKGVN